SRVRVFPSEVAARRQLTDIDLRYNLALRALRIDDVQILRPGGGRPLVIDRLTMRTGEWRDRLRIEDVNVVSPDIDFDARGWLRPRGDYPLDLQVVWGYRPPEKQPPIAGRGRLYGTLRALRLDQRIERPSPARVRGVLREPLFDPSFSGEADFTDLQPRGYLPSSPVTRASGHVAFTSATLGDFAAQARGHVAVEGWGEMDADTALHRVGERWHFEHLTVRRPRAPGHLTWAGDFIAPSGKPLRFAGSASWQQMTWPIDAAAPAVRSARGSAQVEGTADDYDLVVDGIFAFPNVPAGRYQGTAHGDRRQLIARTVEARLLGGRVAGGARIRWRPAVDWQLQATAYGIDPHATWTAVPAALSGGTWKIAGHGDRDSMVVESLRVDNERGSLAATGGFTWGRAFTWQADALTRGISPAALWPQLPAAFGGGDWHVVGHGTDARAELSPVEGAFLGGQVGAAGSVAWQPAVSWSLQGTARGLDPARAFAGWNGSLGGAFRTHGVAADGGVVGEVLVEDVAGTLRGRPLAAHGSVLLRQGAVSLAGVEGTWGPGRLALSGAISPRLALTFEVQQLDLAAVRPGATGIVTASGTLRGTSEAPVVAANLAGDGLGWGSMRAAKLSGRFALDLAPGGAVDVDLQATDLRLGSERLDTLTVVAKGTREAHTLTLALRGEDETVQLAASGGFPDLRGGAPAAGGAVPISSLTWNGTLTQLTADSDETGRWELAAPATVLLGAARVRVQRLCWASGAARLCTDVDWRGAAPGAPAGATGQALDLTATATELPLKLFERLLPPDVQLSGSVNGDARLQTLGGGVLVGQATLRPSAGAALWSATRGEQTRLQLAGGELHLSADAGGVAVRGRLDLTEGGTAQGSVNLPGYRLGRAATAQPLLGRLTVQLGDLRFLAALVPVLGTTGGQATADLALSGTLATPAVAGNAHFSGGHATVPRLGLDLQQVEFTARGDGSGPLAISGSLRSGAGTLTFTGSTPLLPAKGHPLRLDLKGTRVTLASLPAARIIADPDLQLAYDGHLLRVAGEVVVPEAKVTYRRGRAGAVEPSKDVVFVGPQVPQAVSTGMDIAARIHIVLGNDVSLEAEGLKTRLRGAMLVVEEPGEGTRASGQLELVEGTFKAYGQDLTIERGRLNFAGGPLFDPGLDVRAYRRVVTDNVTAGINVRGTLKAPEVTVWSDPAMGESDALSYLLLGRPLEAAQPQEGSLLANAATSLGIKGGDLLARKLGAAFGLEEARIVPGQTLQQAAFVVGKYLSPRLYLSYGIGIFDASSTLRLRYLVSEHLHIEAQAGAQTSGDVLYTIEHGPPSREEMGRYRIKDLPRVKPEEMTTPPKVPVGAEGQEPPKSGAAAEAGKTAQQAERAVRQTEEQKAAEPAPTPTPAPTPHR
ncbi:MAG TPA: translocation/assembly module TamB domain-containing protein, partial [Thermoanaerobaculia bacterium]|nr:translocation/assembly module TamB domain-containing protein [Thermoanaerobaculia bacterium]